MLGERSGASDRPRELTDEDERSDLVALLAWANRRFIFDLDDTSAARQATNSQEQQTDPDDDGFWERYVRDGLSYDPRSQTYRPLLGTHSLNPGDLLLQEITAMLQSAPNERRLRVIRAQERAPAGEPGTGHPWSLSARQQLRARNLLRRWAGALPDPRHAWLSPEAPARNYTALIDVLALIWLGGGLDEETTIELLGDVWTGFLGAPGRKGLADRADEELWEASLASLTEDDRHLAAGLAYCALHPDADPGRSSTTGSRSSYAD